MKLRSIKGRAALKAGIAGSVILVAAVVLYGMLVGYNLAVAVVAAAGFTALAAAFAGYLIAAYEIWEFKKLAETGEKAEKGLVSWDDAIYDEGAPEEVRAVHSVMLSLKKKMDEAVLSQKRFLADASHEMRSPLTIMKGDIEIALRRERPAEEYRAVLSSNLEEIDRMEFLVKDLMFLARADSSELVMNMAPVMLCDIIAAVCDRLSQMARQKGITLHYGAPCNQDAIIDGDPDRLTQLFVNIVENALRYTPEGGSVRVAFKEVAGVYKVEVIDTGIGIPEAELEKIFDRFYRVDKARARVSGGSGLGLCICKWIVESHKGGITIESTEGKGTKVTLMFLPAGS